MTIEQLQNITNLVAHAKSLGVYVSPFYIKREKMLVNSYDYIAVRLSHLDNAPEFILILSEGWECSRIGEFDMEVLLCRQ